MVVATHRVKLFILSTSLRILTARCLYLGFCQAYIAMNHKITTSFTHFQVRSFLTWFRSSAGLILAKREKSMMVICRATSSGSKSKIVSIGEGLDGIWRREKMRI